MYRHSILLLDVRDNLKREWFSSHSRGIWEPRTLDWFVNCSQIIREPLAVVRASRTRMICEPLGSDFEWLSHKIVLYRMYICRNITFSRFLKFSSSQYCHMILQDRFESSNGVLTPGCIILTEEQLDVMLVKRDDSSSNTPSHTIQKRNLVDFQATPVAKWRLPVAYKFDGTQGLRES